jgi:hypothetical protein
MGKVPATTQQSTPTPSTSQNSEEELKIRQGNREFYQQSLSQLKLTHLSEDLLTEMWSTPSEVRKASFLNRFPGIKWTNAISHVIEANTNLQTNLINQAEVELASYFLEKKNRTYKPAQQETTAIPAPWIVSGLHTPAPTVGASGQSTAGPSFIDISAFKRRK